MENEKYRFRRACADDLGRIEEIVHAAQRRLRESGIDQWQNGYPNREVIERDMALGYGRVVCLAGRVVAYGALTYDGESAYNDLQGEGWLTSDGEYLTIHRLCVADEVLGLGVGRLFFAFSEGEARARVASVRVDTHPHNRIMQHLLTRLNYRYCGTVKYESLRWAYEKLLHDEVGCQEAK